MVQRIEGKKVVGVKQTLKCIKNDEGKTLYVAKDAEAHVINPIIELADTKGLPVVYVETTKELGRLCGIDVGAATALVLNCE
jgi:large subunit ribosomal protein L7A